ncbi:hypothetical protein B0H14DRAFT_3447071 [Mycena olivaceomarginata]|nr:hypothetical protein B0H14DRAFT_3447071 [Mycena olivaceomarginata]
MHCKDAHVPGITLPFEPLVVGVCVCVCGWSGDAGGLRALTPPPPALAAFALYSPPRMLPQSQLATAERYTHSLDRRPNYLTFLYALSLPCLARRSLESVACTHSLVLIYTAG